MFSAFSAIFDVLFPSDTSFTPTGTGCRLKSEYSMVMLIKCYVLGPTLGCKVLGASVVDSSGHATLPRSSPNAQQTCGRVN